MKGPSNKPRTLFEITVVALVAFALLLVLDRGLFAKETQDIKFETYTWHNLSPDALEPSVGNDDVYQPIALRISGDVEEHTGIKLEKIVEQGGEVIFNFFYTDTSPLISGHCDLVEIIILTKEGKLTDDFVLTYTESGLSINRKTT